MAEELTVRGHVTACGHNVGEWLRIGTERNSHRGAGRFGKSGADPIPKLAESSLPACGGLVWNFTAPTIHNTLLAIAKERSQSQPFSLTLPNEAGDPAPGQPPLSTLYPVKVRIGGAFVTPAFAGLTPGFAGLYQVNVRIPEALPAGIHALRVLVNGIGSDPVSLFVGPAGDSGN